MGRARIPTRSNGLGPRADNCGNATSCLQTIEVEDTTDPSITCPAGATIQCGDDDTPSALGTATSTDNCDNDPTVSFSDNQVSGSCPDTYTIQRTWTAEDNCGNSTCCLQTIEVEDTTPPSITCPADVTVECSDDLTSATQGMATASDNCDNDPTITEADVITPGACDDAYTITRTWTAEDDCGNSTNCDQTITVEDTTDPTWDQAMPADVTIECDNNLPIPTITASDNCDDDVMVDFTETSAPGVCVQATILTRTWTATDDCGNAITHTQTITQDDTTPSDLDQTR